VRTGNCDPNEKKDTHKELLKLIKKEEKVEVNVGEALGVASRYVLINRGGNLAKRTRLQKSD